MDISKLIVVFIILILYIIFALYLTLKDKSKISFRVITAWMAVVGLILILFSSFLDSADDYAGYFMYLGTPYSKN